MAANLQPRASPAPSPTTPCPHLKLGLEIQNTKAKKKKLAPGILTSKLRFRAEVVGGSRKYQDAKFELISWIENQLNTQVPATERVAALDDGSGVAVATSQDSE